LGAAKKAHHFEILLRGGEHRKLHACSRFNSSRTLCQSSARDSLFAHSSRRAANSASGSTTNAPSTAVADTDRHSTAGCQFARHPWDKIPSCATIGQRESISRRIDRCDDLRAGFFHWLGGDFFHATHASGFLARYPYRHLGHRFLGCPRRVLDSRCGLRGASRRAHCLDTLSVVSGVGSRGISSGGISKGG